MITSIAAIGVVLIYFSIANWWLGDAIRAAAEAAGYSEPTSEARCIVPLVTDLKGGPR